MKEKPITRVTTKQLHNLEGLTNWKQVDALTDKEAEQNALRDPDNQPLPEELLEKFRSVSPEERQERRKK